MIVAMMNNMNQMLNVLSFKIVSNVLAMESVIMKDILNATKGLFREI